MSALFPEHSPIDLPERETARPALPWCNWLREPLLHFLLAGAALFALDHVLVARSDDPRTIVVGPEVDAEARDTVRSARGTDPTDEQLAALRQHWLDNEVLYREGMALRVDRGDPAIRDRVIFKALSIVDAGTRRPPLDDTVLRAWFEKNRARYDEPMRFDFQEAVVSGERTEAAVRELVAKLNGGASGEAGAGLRVFKGRPRANVEQSYGTEFAAALESAAPGEWQAYRTKDGWRAMRLDAVTPGRAADFEALRPALIQDWTDAVMAEQRSAAVRELQKKYRVVERS